MNNKFPYDNIWRRGWGSIVSVLKKKYLQYEFRGESHVENAEAVVKISVWVNNNCIQVIKVKESDLDIDETFIDRFDLLLSEEKSDPYYKDR